MILERVDVNQFTQISLMWEAKFGDDLLSYICNCLWIYVYYVDNSVDAL